MLAFHAGKHVLCTGTRCPLRAVSAGQSAFLSHKMPLTRPDVHCCTAQCMYLARGLVERARGRQPGSVDRHFNRAGTNERTGIVGSTRGISPLVRSQAPGSGSLPPGSVPVNQSNELPHLFALYPGNGLWITERFATAT